METKTFFSIHPEKQISILNAEIPDNQLTTLSLPIIENKDLEKFELVSEGILIADIENSKILMANSSFCNLVNHSFPDIIKLEIKDLFNCESDLITADTEIIKKFQLSSIKESLIRNKNNNLLHVLATTSSVIYNQQKCLFISIQNINELKKVEDIIRFQNYHDAITNLPNKKLFIEQLSLSLGHNQIKEDNLAIIKLRLNSWKKITNLLDFDSENKLLLNIIKQIKVILCAGDTLARFADDEYIIILEEAKDNDKIDLPFDRK